MNRIPIAGLMITILTAGCGPVIHSNPEMESWHIFPADEARSITMQCSRPSPGPISDTWEPTKELVEEIEAPLRTLLQEKINSNYYPVNVDATEYSFQVAGLIIDEQRVLYINGILTGFLYDDLSKPIVLCDGGAVTFGVEYVVPEQTFRNFYFNGEV